MKKRENGKRKTKGEAENMIEYTEQVKLTGHKLINNVDNPHEIKSLR
jgi:hypothetical protein